MRAVRSQQHGRAVCGQGALGEKRVFSLVTFFAPAKKVTRDIQSRKLWLSKHNQLQNVAAIGSASPSPQPSPPPAEDREKAEDFLPFSKSYPLLGAEALALQSSPNQQPKKLI